MSATFRSTRYTNFFLSLLFSFFLVACAARQEPIAVDSDSVVPGGSVTRQGTQLALLGTPIEVGKPLPPVELVEAATMKNVDLRDYRGSVLLLSIVPSIDTKVCEAQTHYLGEEGDKLPSDIRRITISRDTPFAQRRFAEEADLEDITYLSDYKSGAFGRSLGLLVDGPLLLARSVLVVDRQGVVRYLQVVPELTHLPDMERAFAEARRLN